MNTRILSTFCAAWTLGTAVQTLAQGSAAPVVDTRPDTFSGVDGLGRVVPMQGDSFAGANIPAPRVNRFVAMFTFLWHGEHGRQGPFDITKTLARDANAMQKPDSPLWGPKFAPHHWSEPHFGYYLSDDPWVWRRHAQMLSDAGVDVVVFDVTNGFTYPRSYHALCRVWTQIRREGGRTPQIAFLAPFGDPSRVALALYEDLYRPKRYADLWFRWKGKPLLMADADAISVERLAQNARSPVALSVGTTLGQTFRAERPLSFVGAPFPTWNTRNAGVTVSVFDRPGGKRLARRKLTNLVDNAVVGVHFSPPLPPGSYYFEQSEPVGQVGWWSLSGDVVANGQAWADGVAVSGDRTLSLQYVGETGPTVLAPDGAQASRAHLEARVREMREFWTWRKPRPDYFGGPDGGRVGEWGWLDVTPQKEYRDAQSKPEQMTVGVAQNAADGKLSVLSHPRAHGRSFYNGSQPPLIDRDFTGRNVQEQWQRALQFDPQLIFVTGWNEWIAGRFGSDAPFYQPGPVAFVDQFDAEFSRDIEPVRGAHGDAYYLQFLSYVRRFKGARAPQKAGPPRSIQIDGLFNDWKSVASVFHDDRYDTTHRDHAAWKVGERHINRSGRNDFVQLKVARDAQHLHFYAQTRTAVSPATNVPTASNEWMNLLINSDSNWKSGWLGFDVRVNAARHPLFPQQTSLERWRNNRWQRVAWVKFRAQGREMELSIPRVRMSLNREPFTLDFKWLDNVGAAQNPLNFYSHGDTAPNGRLSYRIHN